LHNPKGDKKTLESVPYKRLGSKSLAGIRSVEHFGPDQKKRKPGKGNQAEPAPSDRKSNRRANGKAEVEEDSDLASDAARDSSEEAEASDAEVSDDATERKATSSKSKSAAAASAAAAAANSRNKNPDIINQRGELLDETLPDDSANDNKVNVWHVSAGFNFPAVWVEVYGQPYPDRNSRNRDRVRGDNVEQVGYEAQSCSVQICVCSCYAVITALRICSVSTEYSRYSICYVIF